MADTGWVCAADQGGTRRRSHSPVRRLRRFYGGRDGDQNIACGHSRCLAEHAQADQRGRSDVGAGRSEEELRRRLCLDQLHADPGRYLNLGKRCFVGLAIKITTKRTGDTFVTATLPFNIVADSLFGGKAPG
ncbi:hypothetical protein [Bradyrhizobium sp. USDA 4353]